MVKFAIVPHRLLQEYNGTTQSDESSSIVFCSGVEVITEYTQYSGVAAWDIRCFVRLFFVSVMYSENRTITHTHLLERKS